MQAIGVSDQSELGHARREAEILGRRFGFSDEDRGRFAIMVTELGTNLIKHAARGEILIGSCDSAKENTLEVFALDKGPGIPDIEASLADGYSTAGSHGTGLGAIKRQATTFDVFSQPGAGTVVHARLCRGNVAYVPSHRTNWSVVSRPFGDEPASGDNYAIRESDNAFIALVADGLGHGAYAAHASLEAVKVFERSQSSDADELAESVHLGLQSTRGAAIAVSSAEYGRGVVTYSGIGNIAGTLLEDCTTRKMIAHNGTAGVVARRIHGFQYPFKAQTLLLMHSDGIGSGWSLDKYPGLAQREPALIAGVIYRDFSRTRDDALILVARLGP
jgi:anti-sigma regulatory factor (Ser/Thr protein kinase)